MPVYTWEGTTDQGVRKGEMEAANKSAVINNLGQLGIKPNFDKIKKKSSWSDFNITLGSGVSEDDIISFTDQLSTMVDSGMVLVKSLSVLAEQQQSKNFKDILIRIRRSIESGSTFADSLSRHPKLFSSLYVSLVRSGEAGGILVSSLKRLADYMRRTRDLKKRVQRAMIYPSIVTLVAVAVIMILLVYVIPIFTKIFADMQTTLPPLTQGVVTLSYFVKANVVYLLAVIVVFCLFVSYSYSKSKRFRRSADGLILRAPLVGDLIKKLVISRFCRTLGELTRAGVTLLDGLETASSTSGNLVVQEAIMSSRERVSRGETLAFSLQQSPNIFSILVVSMVNVGEQTGSIDSMMEKIADFYEQEVDNAVDSITSTIEPLLMVFIGVTVGVLVMAMYLPMFKLISTLS